MTRVQLSNWVEGQLVPVAIDEETEAVDSYSSVVVALYKRPSDPPAWQKLVEEMLGLTDFGGGGQSRGAIIYCSTEVGPDGQRRWVAWCFGSGSRLISRKHTDPRFGLIAALNTLVVSPDPTQGATRAPRVRNLEYRETTPDFKQTGHRAARDIPVDAFRIDRSSDLLSGAGGHTSDPVFADIFGSRSLKFRHQVTSINDLEYLSRLVVERASQTVYQDEIGWADNIWPVDDPDLEEGLKAALWTALTTTPIPGSVDALIPDDLVSFDDDRSIQYISYPREHGGAAGRTTLTPEMLAQYVTGTRVKKPGPHLLDTELRFLDSAEEPIGSASIQDCLCAELVLDGVRYVAYEGGFFQVDKGFVEGIDAEVSAILPTELDLPCYRGGREDGYITAVGRDHPDRFAVLDQKLIRLDGQTPFETCDLLANSGALVHLKRKGKASVLSHLFGQVIGACSALKVSQDARDQLEAFVKDSGADQAVKDAAFDRIRELSPATGGMEVVFGFLGDWQSKTILSLPLLSRIALASAARRVQLLGFQPTVALVDRCR